MRANNTSIDTAHCQNDVAVQMLLVGSFIFFFPPPGVLCTPRTHNTLPALSLAEIITFDVGRVVRASSDVTRVHVFHVIIKVYCVHTHVTKLICRIVYSRPPTHRTCHRVRCAAVVRFLSELCALDSATSLRDLWSQTPARRPFKST